MKYFKILSIPAFRGLDNRVKDLSNRRRLHDNRRRLHVVQASAVT
jgi:hypothetical protein